MAAMLAEIKSRMLLPRQQEEGEEEEDPRAQLIRRLQEYERYREVAEKVDALPRLYRDLWQASAQSPQIERTLPRPEIDLQELLLAFAEVLRRADLNESHHIQRQSLSTRERMSQILLRVSAEHFTPLVSLLMKDEGRLGVVVTFLAVMELIKESLVELVQNEPFGPIHIKARAA
jgi:segregation and condensation protein A